MNANGVVFNNASNEDEWDDACILKAFDQAIHAHINPGKTKK